MGEKRADGITWAWWMLALMTIEWLVLIEVVFFDRGAEPLFSGGLLGLYFVGCTASLLLQAAGIALVRRGRHRAGGVLQIVASSFHAPKGEGVIGIIGGTKACRMRTGPTPVQGPAKA